MGRWMNSRLTCIFTAFTAAGILACTSGCSWQSAAWSGGQAAYNLSKEDTFLRIKLDGHKAEQNAAKKAMTGWSNWKISEPVSCSPKLVFSIKKPEKLGRITTVIANIHQQFEADYSHQADFTIVPRDNTAEAQMKPDTEYDLSNPGGAFKVLDIRGNEIPSITMDPGKKYKLILTIKADHSESAAIEFKTK